MYDFGVSDIRLLRATLGEDPSEQPYFLLCAQVANTQNHALNQADYAPDTSVELYIDAHKCDLAPLSAEEAASLGLPTHTGAKWFAVPQTTLTGERHLFSVRATQPAPASTAP